MVSKIELCTIYSYNLRMKKKEMPFSEARENLTSVLDGIERNGEPVIILRRGKPTAVIISHQMYEQRIQTGQANGWRLAGSLKVAPGFNVDESLAEGKRERIALWEKRMERYGSDRK